MSKILNKIITFFVLILSFLILANFCYSQELAQISNVQDFADFRWQGNGDLEGNSALCVFSDTGRYSVNIQGSNGGFFLQDNASSIPFSVKWSHTSSPNNATSVSHNITLTGQTGAKTNFEDCEFSNNANITISFNESDLQNAKAGSYTGYLTIIVEAIY